MSRLPIYDTRQWRDRTSPQVRKCNPICQRIDDTGQQCTRPSKIVHHLKDPKDAPEKALSWDNLVAVCVECHPGGQRGADPTERYCATIGLMGMIYYHGLQLLPCWHRDYKPLPATSVAKQTGATTSLVGAHAIDAALGRWA